MHEAIVLKPRVSEKAYGLSGKDNKANVYVFDVENANNKHTVARAIEAQYNVTVTGVNITNLKGKAKRTVRKGGRPVAGRTSDVKKAYVTLKAGQSLPIFAAVEEAAEKEAKTTEQFAKAAEKASAKEEKQTVKEAKKAEKESKKADKKEKK
jgi:large subunit ribosomal protein L23